MNYKEFTDIFKKQVYALSYEKHLDFALCICKKLYFDYQVFHTRDKWGDPEMLMDAIKMCEKTKKNPLEKREIETMIHSVEIITPDMEEFGDEIGSFALNACVAVLHTLQYLLTNDPSDIFFIGNALYDTIDIRVQENQNLSEEQIDYHPLMQETKRYLLELTK